MNPQNKKAIYNEYSSSSKSQKQQRNLRQRKNKNEIQSSESYEKANISESIVDPKRKKQFHGVENANSESKEDERKIDFWEKSEKQKVLNIKIIKMIKKEKKMPGQRKIMMKFKKIKPEKILLI